MERQKRAKARGGADAAALAPEIELASLEALVTADPQDPNWDAHLMAALGALNHPAIPPLLAALFGQARDKIRRKALKKTLHRLKTRGVAFADDLLPREEASFGAPRPGSVAVFVSPIFGAGESYVIFEGPPEILGGNFLVARVSDTEGFRECVLLSLKRKQQAEFWDQFREQGLEHWFSPPTAYAVRLLEEAYTRPTGPGPGAAQYGALREKIFRYWGRASAAPDLDRELPALAPGEHSRFLEHSRKLALDPWFHSWLPGPEEIAPWLAKLQEVQDSPLVLSEQQKQVRTDGVLEEATRALYPAESRAVWGRRLMTTAYYLHLSGREEDSRAARAAAADLEEADRSALFGENPFLKGLVQYAVRLAWEMQQPREPGSPSGLVAPPTEAGLIRRGP
jgi:hypothetical protein